MCNLWSEFVQLCKLNHVICSVVQENSSELFWSLSWTRKGRAPWRRQTLTYQILVCPGHAQTVTTRLNKTSAPPQLHRLVPVGQIIAAAPEAKDEQQPPRTAQSLHLRNNLMVWERIQRRHTQEELYPFKYKLDQKVIHTVLPFGCVFLYFTDCRSSTL